MVQLLAGLAIFFASHLFTSFARQARQRLVGRLGENGYKGLYSLLSLLGFVLIVRGWRQVGPGPLLWRTGEWAWPIAYLLVAAAFILLAAAYLPAGKLKGWTGHPMVTGLILFSFGHLLVNGDARSALVFGAFLTYGVLDRVAVKLRGETGPAPGAPRWDVVAVGGGLASYALVVAYLHPLIAGVGLNPGAVFGF